MMYPQTDIAMYALRNTLLTATVVALSLALAPGTALAASSSPTEVVTGPAEATSNGVKLKGKLNPGGLPTTYYFEYGSVTCDELPSCKKRTAVAGPLTGGAQQEVPAVEVTGLAAGGTYWYRLVASNADGAENGAFAMFTAGTAQPPSIESESASNITQSDATLEAEINPQGAAAGDHYQFQLVTNPSEYASEILCPPKLPPGWDGCDGAQSASALPIGFVPGNTLQPGRTLPASLGLASAGVTLQPGATYHYRVLVARRVQTEDTIEWEAPTVYGPDQTFTTPPAALAPAIDSVSVSHLAPTDATLEAQINTEGLATIYEFQLSYTHCRECESPTVRIQLPSGLLLGSFVDQSVSLDLGSAGVQLQGGYYEYSILATNSAGSTEAHAQAFEPPLPGAQPQGVEAPSTTHSDSQSGTASTSAGSEGSSSSLGVTPLDSPLENTTEVKTLTKGHVLAQALKACAKKPRGKRAACEKQARKRYGATARKSKKG